MLAAHNADAINAIQTDYENVAVPKVYEAVTGNKYEDLTSPTSSTQDMDSLMNFMVEDTGERIDSIQKNIAVASSSSNAEVRNEALRSAQSDAAVVEQEMSALSVAFNAVETASGTSSGTAASVDAAAEDAKTASDILDDILNGNRDIDLINDLQLVYDTLGTVRVTLTETVYPALDTLLSNLQDSLGDVSSLLLDLNGILGKSTPIVSELGNTFGAVNNALIQVQDLLASYSSRINDFIDLLNGSDDNGVVQGIFDFFNVDPESIGAFLSSPLSMRIETIYPIESYGAGMAPFYTILAIWVGCVMINAIMKIDSPVELLGATPAQKFLGRYLLFFLISQAQALVITVGDILVLGINCQHPGLFILAGAASSLACSMIAYCLAVIFGNVGKMLSVVIMIIQIAGSGGSYPIELLPEFFQEIYLLFPFPYAINAMREAIAGLYGNQYLVYMLLLLLFFAVFLVLGLTLKRPLSGMSEYMDEQLEKTEMM